MGRKRGPLTPVIASQYLRKNEKLAVGLDPDKHLYLLTLECGHQVVRSAEGRTASCGFCHAS